MDRGHLILQNIARSTLPLLAAAALASSLHAQQALNATAMNGTLGPYRIGATFWIKDHVTFVAGHYFYAAHLKDIPLISTSQSGASLELTEAEGGIFHLHLTGNGSEHGAPLTFYNSVALDGTWTKDRQTLPVHLGFTYSQAGNIGDRHYADVTGESDSEFELRSQRFIQSVLSGDRAAAGSLVSYPLRVNGPQRLTIRDPAALNAHWSSIFTPSFLAQLKAAVPHEMFVRNGQAMLGNGLVWFDNKGASSLNLH